MFQAKKVSRNATSFSVSLSDKGIHLHFANENGESTILLESKEDVRSIVESAKQALKLQSFQACINLPMNAETETQVYVDGHFFANGSQKDWFVMAIGVSLYPGGRVTTKKYLLHLRKKEVEQIINILWTYWS